MTQTTTVIDIHTNQFKEIYKRLLLQPITFNVTETDFGGKVEITTKEGVEHLITHLTSYVHEDVVSGAINDVFISQGAYPEWAKVRLIPRLSIDEMDTPWREAIHSDITDYVQKSLLDNKPLKIQPYLTFGTQEIRDSARILGDELEDVTFFGIIERTISALEIDNLPSHSVPSDTSIELVGDPSNMKFLTEPDDEGVQSEVLNTDDLVTGVANLYAESVYFPDSERYKEAQFYTYTLMMMKRWNIKKWIVPEDTYIPLESYRSRLDIPVMIEVRGTTD